TDAGGIALNLENEREVVDAYQAIMRSCKTRFPNARIRGIEVCKMVPKGIETIVGGIRDPSFGPVVMFGLGGIYVEVLKDIAFRAAPLDVIDAEEMISEIRTYPILLGVRGEGRRDIEGIADVILKIGRLMVDVEEISDIEINPLMVYEHGGGVNAVDIRIIVRRRNV
ncbi:MAG TPA: acetyl-CoA synthetase, partial [Thermoplasmatales archaeon]|nr:acetyl-CoA synthetase [Thermoplasmatales archaeon]